MTVYNINLGIGWASSGVEYAQAYRAKIFREMGQEAKFVFMDLILGDNIEHMTSKIGFQTMKSSGSITILQISKLRHRPLA